MPGGGGLQKRQLLWGPLYPQMRRVCSPPRKPGFSHPHGREVGPEGLGARFLSFSVQSANRRPDDAPAHYAPLVPGARDQA